MSISKITKNLEGVTKFPPVESWNPELCEGQEFFINREGDWYLFVYEYRGPLIIYII